MCCRYCWTHRELGGYVQGMCDILAPLLVVLEDGMPTVGTGRHIVHLTLHLLCTATDIRVFSGDYQLLLCLPGPVTSVSLLSAESLVYHCYVQQMERMQHHFPPNQGVSEKLANLRALVEVR